jgi:hypothetical protein
MAETAHARGAAPGAAVISLDETIAAKNSVNPVTGQGCPVERHDPLPTDKLIWHAVPRLQLLVGTWQGPGSIAQLRRRARA